MKAPLPSQMSATTPAISATPLPALFMSGWKLAGPPLGRRGPRGLAAEHPGELAVEIPPELVQIRRAVIAPVVQDHRGAAQPRPSALQQISGSQGQRAQPLWPGGRCQGVVSHGHAKLKSWFQ
jgi:hypothetical protein